MSRIIHVSCRIHVFVKRVALQNTWFSRLVGQINVSVNVGVSRSWILTWRECATWKFNMTWTWRFSRWKSSTWTWCGAQNVTFTSRFTLLTFHVSLPEFLEMISLNEWTSSSGGGQHAPLACLSLFLELAQMEHGYTSGRQEKTEDCQGMDSSAPK